MKKKFFSESYIQIIPPNQMKSNDKNIIDSQKRTIVFF